MIARTVRSFADETGGAISPMFAVAILPLVVMAGVGFDYGRMMALDSELQNAADHAALAAATQLDGSEDAIANAETAAANALGNETRFANDGAGRAIPTAGLTFEYFEDYVDDAPVDPTTEPEDARVVQVTVENRAVRYALTPVMAAFSGDVARGRAIATLQDATCNVPPLMFCTPNNAFPSYGQGDAADDRGKGVPLHMKKNQAGSQSDAENPLWAPGNFGFLDIPYDLHGNPNRTLGINTTASGCIGDPVESRTGFRTTEAKALNTRFDFYEPPLNACDTGNGDFCPAENVRKNWVRVETHNNVRPQDIAGLACNPEGSGSWKAISEIPSGESPPTSNPGYPCDSAGCTAFGSGDWPGASWFTTTHPTESFDSVPDLDGNGTISRYEVYMWEQDAEFPSRLAPAEVGRYLAPPRPNGRRDVKLYCSYPAPIDQSPYTAGVQKDRRVLTVAAVDCTGLTGHAVVDIKKWVDIFLVTPADKTTGTDDALNGRAFYGEIVGPAQLAGGGSGFQYYSRKKAVLLR